MVGTSTAIQNVSDKEQNVFEFIRDRHLLGRVFIGLPAGGCQQANVLQRGVGFLWGHCRIQQIDEVLDDVLFFAKNGPPGRLGWVGGKNRLDRQRVKQVTQAVRIEPGCLQFDERVFKSTGLLCRIHHLKVGGETAYDLQCLIRIQATDKLDKRLTGLFVAFASPDSAQTSGLDKLVKFIAVLLANQVAQHGTETSNVVAQRLVFIFEAYVLAPK